MRGTVTMAKMHQWIAWIGAASTMGSVAGAQSPAPCAVPVALGAISLAPNPTVGAAYSATVRTTVDQTLDDGSVIHLSITTHQARDGAGRHFDEESFGCRPGPDGERHPVLRRFVTDPATGTTTSWTVDDSAKVLHVLHEPPRVARPTVPPTTKQQSPEDERRAMVELGIDPGVDLGSKKIAGVVAEGNRTAGGTQTGHKVVDERWIAKDLGLEMLRITDNPKTGRTTVEVVDLKQGKPDPALFAPPAGYTNGASNPAQ